MKKTLFSILLILLINHSSQALDQNPDDAQLAYAWKIQCRIKQKGTFDLTSIIDKKQNIVALKNDLKNLKQQLSDCAPGEGDDDCQETLQAEIDTKTQSIEDFQTKDKETREELDTEISTLKSELHTDEQKRADDISAASDDETPDTSEIDDIIQGDKDKLHVQEKKIQIYLNGREEDQIHLFLEDDENTVELPKLCQNRLDSTQQLQLGTQAVKIKSQWVAAFSPPGRKKSRKLHHSKQMRMSRQEQPLFIFEKDEEENVITTSHNMPPLNKEQFKIFYDDLSKNVKEQDGAIYSSEEDTDEMKTDKQEEIFKLATFNKNREFINWLEFWVYMCADGNQPKDDEYMAADDDEIVLQNVEKQLENKPMWDPETTKPTEPLDADIYALTGGDRRAKAHRFNKRKHNKHHH